MKETVSLKKGNCFTWKRKWSKKLWLMESYGLLEKNVWGKWQSCESFYIFVTQQNNRFCWECCLKMLPRQKMIRSCREKKSNESNQEKERKWWYFMNDTRRKSDRSVKSPNPIKSFGMICFNKIPLCICFSWVSILIPNILFPFGIHWLMAFMMKNDKSWC